MSNEPMISTQIVLPVADRLRELGIRAGPLLQELSVDKDVLEDVNAVIPLRKYVAFFERAASASNSSFFGLDAGSSVEVSTGALNFLFLSAPTLADAITGLHEYLSALQESSHFNIHLEKDQAQVAYRIIDETVAPRRQDAEYSIAATCRLISSYTGSRFIPKEVWFEHERIGSHSYYEAVLGCDVFFGQNTNSIFFDKELMSISAPSISHKLYPIITAHLQGIISSKDKTTTQSGQLANLLDQRELERGVSAKKVAEALGMSESTLARRLKAEGTSFIEVLTEKRMSIAKRLLENSDIAIGEIALKVGYSENASFSRAFKTWCGSTPEKYRAGAVSRNIV